MFLSSLFGRTTASAIAALVLTMVFWAGNHVLGRWATGQIPPMTFAFLRWSVAAAIMLPIAWRSLRHDWPIIRSNLPILMLLSALSAGFYNTIQYVALTQTTVTNAAILNSWAPVLIAAGGALFFKDELRPIQIAGLMISLTGVATIVLHGDLETLRTFAFNRGDWVMLFGIFVWASYTVLLRKRPQGISTPSLIGFTFAFATLTNLPLAAYEHLTDQRVQWSGATIAAVAFAAVPASVIGYYLYARSVELIGPTRAGAFSHLIPLFASAMALILLGEAPQLYHAVGFGLILSGVALTSTRPSARLSAWPKAN